MEIDVILKPFQRFGVHLGLKRIQRLLARLDNPHLCVPVIHVAGTNGKGSVCAYLSSVLTQAGYRVGRYTSPHLVDWTERICLNEQLISAQQLEQVLLQVKDRIDPASELPTQFEVITAAAWLYFAQNQVDVAVVEVGLGGRLDATNVCDRPLVSIITSISRDHWQNLGPTLADIAKEKAGILKPGCLAVVGPLPPVAEVVVRKQIELLGCPAVWPQPALPLAQGWAEYYTELLSPIQYPLPLPGEFQLTNSALSVAALQSLQQRGWEISREAIVTGMAKTRWPGRLEWTTWRNHQLLIDGAHNSGAAISLRQYVDTLDVESVTWVVGILSSKDYAEILSAILRSGDRLYAVPVPDHAAVDPTDLVDLAYSVCSDLSDRRAYPDLVTALDAAITFAEDNLVVLCGSLYLIGHFLRTAEEPARSWGFPP
ncbi:MAG: bifunctional folylpolyglutamate synthase/dihydrofolate synthase [Chroococcidiopsidaceae cyanobacterium CP_BM_ER_R8_30]|nr:bifunctional folylpolyglutamate synthase/dihydrofolate synthase [Chroococcidiopsidaceae cyanobacterium CP_BM_ER_R8_30]